jgi:hypothetical protein
VCLLSSNKFLFELDKILGTLTQLCSLRLRLTVHTFSPALVGYNMDPRYPETVFHHKFAHLTELEYTIQGESQNGGDCIHLPYFLNDHPTLKKLKLIPSPSPHCRFDFLDLAPDTVITLPQLQALETPFKCLSYTWDVPALQTIVVEYPLDGFAIQRLNASGLEDIWHNGRLVSMFPELQEITVHRAWEYPNIEFLSWISGHFHNLRSLDIQGHYWVVCSALKSQSLTKQKLRNQIMSIFLSNSELSKSWRHCNMVASHCLHTVVYTRMNGKQNRSPIH